jgi:hypothetical protein
VEILPVLPLAELTKIFSPDRYEALPFHTHNDYKKDRPLFDSLKSGVRSIEADIYLDWPPRKKIRVGHNPWENDGSLEDLYLEPLQKAINNREVVLSPHDPLLLWIDVKGGDISALPQLSRTLANYPMIGKEVKIIFTGGGRHKEFQKHFQKNYPHLGVVHDSNRFPMKNPAPNQWYTLNWRKHTSWRGRGPMPEAEFQKVKKLVEEIHASGGRLRFYNSPDDKSYWELLQRLNVDLINTDQPKGLREHWDKFMDIFNPPKK